MIPHRPPRRFLVRSIHVPTPGKAPVTLEHRDLDACRVLKTVADLLAEGDGATLTIQPQSPKRPDERFAGPRSGGSRGRE